MYVPEHVSFYQLYESQYPLAVTESALAIAICNHLVDPDTTPDRVTAININSISDISGLFIKHMVVTGIRSGMAVRMTDVELSINDHGNVWTYRYLRYLLPNPDGGDPIYFPIEAIMAKAMAIEILKVALAKFNATPVET